MLVINVLTHRNPLYGVQTWAATLPLGLLWGDGIQAYQFNDDALGRVLEDLAHHGPKVLAMVGLRVQSVHPTLSEGIHSDTTAYSLMGDYPSASTGSTAPVDLTWGNSKDHRPDLKQIMAGITMDAQGCVPAGKMLSGNTSDRRWNADWVDELTKEFPGNFWLNKCYIADSAMVAKPAIKRTRAAGMHWLGRLSARFSLCGDLKHRAWDGPNRWEVIGTPTAKSATYRYQTFDVTFYDEPARAFVYYSPALDRKKEHTLQREIEHERTRITKVTKKLAGKAFSSAEDARQAADILQQESPLRWHQVTPIIVEQEVPARAAEGRGSTSDSDGVHRDAAGDRSRAGGHPTRTRTALHFYFADHANESRGGA